MAYVPSLADTQEALTNSPVNNGYSPTLGDTQEAMLHAQLSQQAPTNPSLLPRLGADALAGLAQFGNGLINAPHNIANAISPSIGAKIPTYLPNYNYGQALGVNAPNLGDKLLQGAAQYAPFMPLGGLGGGAAFGLTQTQSPLTGALLGGAAGKLADAAPAILNATTSGVGKIINAVRPQKQAEKILTNLGAQNTLEGNAQSLAGDIKNAYQQQIQNGQAQYAPIFNALGNNPIYNRVAPIFGVSQKGAYENIGNAARQNYTGDLKDLHDTFISNPTLNNAHQLQSQLGAEIGSLNYQNAKGLLDTQGKNQLQSLGKARGALLGDINAYLGNQGLDMLSAYKSATRNWQNNVTPYLADSNLAQIAKGEITNPSYSQINTIFKNPEPEINKVVSDIGPSANNKILYNELGKTQSKLTPEKLSSAFDQLDNKGLASYVTPDLAQQFENMSRKISAHNIARTAGGAVIGAHFGGSFGAAAGAIVTPVLSSALSKAAQFIPDLRTQLLNNALINAGVRPVASVISKRLPGATIATIADAKGNQ